MKVLELKGEGALDALNGLYSLLMGVKMLPQYEYEPFDEFFDRVAKLGQDEQTKIIKLAMGMVRPEPQALRGMLAFCTDANGVRFSKENIGNVTMPDMINMVVAVSLEILSWDIGLITNSEKKN